MEQEQTNLSEMIKDQQPAPVFQESNLDLPDETEAAEAADSTTDTVEEPQVEAVPIAPLNTWFEANLGAFENVNEVKAAIRGVDPTKTLIMAVLDGQGEVDGYPSRELQLFKNADSQPVLNLPASDMQVYNNGFKLIYGYAENIAIKSYGVRTGLICVFCNIINSQMIPYQVVKVKKKDEEVEVVRKDPSEVITKLAQNADLESLQLMYKQSSKAISEMTTNQSVVSWLLDRQNEVTDINHHLQIDNVIIDILS